ncbi:MAG: magnesium transporter CorA [Frankiales bacterium]|nr:magnesium transporter CorA [Frankiales bacterium]
MIRGFGLYSDGEPRHDLVTTVERGTRLSREKVPELRRAWDQARDGGPDSFVWLGLRDCALAEFERAAGVFGIDELQVEDAMSIGQRARVEVQGDHVFAVFKVLGYVDATSDVETGQIAVFVGPSYVLSVRLGQPGDLSRLRTQLESDADMLRCGPMAVLHGILDVVVDGYQAVVDELAIDIEQIEEQVFSPERTDDAPTIYKLKRENLEVRRALDPLRPVADRLIGQQLVAIPDDLAPYYRDLGDHLLRVQEQSAQHDALLGTVLEASRSRQAVQQNDDMRKISAWVAIAAVPTMIAGIEGMNFKFMPELDQPWGYPVTLALMLVICLLLYRAFKRSGWL